MYYVESECVLKLFFTTQDVRKSKISLFSAISFWCLVLSLFVIGFGKFPPSTLLDLFLMEADSGTLLKTFNPPIR